MLPGLSTRSSSTRTASTTSRTTRFHHMQTLGAANDDYEFVKSIGRFKETKRTDGISTSDIIKRILKDYNQYIMWNITRGYTRKDLGVSYVKEKQFRVNMGITKLKEKVKEIKRSFTAPQR
uniref:Uncharacterized protein n=1 Tax=Aegilops tauschii subsp. strangulata TaxID=200361 RepID=A0A453RWT8_AEGTS